MKQTLSSCSARRRIMISAMMALVLLAACQRGPNEIGSVNTEFKLLGPSHKIVIESYDDPKIDGITIFISESQKGGIKGALGLAEQTSDVSVAVRQTGPIKVKEAFANGEDALSERRSVLFKHLHITRFWDAAHRTLVYVAWTDRVLTGSPRSSISAVVAEPWASQAPDLSMMGPAASASPGTQPSF
ncbi:MAG TPA: CreA family protein [Candidatus Binataceae bacterium]|jgi:CreA protein|nr:CreA family protein [Candidatus Binataceae bacterium]